MLTQDIKFGKFATLASKSLNKSQMNRVKGGNIIEEEVVIDIIEEEVVID